MTHIRKHKDKILRGLRNWEISLIARKIFIEEIAFDLSFEERKGFRHTEVGMVITEQETARLTSQRCAYTGCKVEDEWGQRR